MIRRVLLAVFAALVVPASASAHASLVGTRPANGAVLARPPAQIRVVFDDVVRVGPGIAAIRNGGGSILTGRPHVEGSRTLVFPVRRGLPEGAYSVRWSIVSDDGHLESGVLAFAVGIGRPAPMAALTAEATGPAVGDVIARWLFLAGVLGAVGIALFTLATRAADDERIALTLSAAAVLAAVGAAEQAHRVGLATRAGTALGAGFLAAVAVALLAGAATLERRALLPALVLALGLAAVPSFAGHALDRGLNRVNVLVDVLHVAGASAWVGTLLGLLLVRGAVRRRAVALALAGVLVLGTTGVVRAWFELLRVSQLWETAYGRALLVKTALLSAALVSGWLLRTRIRRRAGIELVAVAGIVVAVSVLVLVRPGRNVAAAPPAQVGVSEPSPQPPAPPPRAVVLARQVGTLGVALELEHDRVTAIVLSPAGGGLSGLDVRLDGRGADRCGHGCYRVDETPGGTVEVEIAGLGPRQTTRFELPPAPRPADQLVRRAQHRYRALRSVLYRERLASSPQHMLTVRWRLEAPNRLEYAIPGGAGGIVIGPRRWDRASDKARWQESSQTPLPQPATQWTYATNAHVVARDGETTTVTFVDPTTPAFFRLVLDARTLMPRVLHMTAAAHFMTDRYLRFNAPRAIRPPR